MTVSFVDLPDIWSKDLGRTTLTKFFYQLPECNFDSVPAPDSLIN